MTIIPKKYTTTRHWQKEIKMNNRLITLLGICLALQTTLLHASEKVRITEHHDVDGTRTFWFTTKAALSKCPEWDMSQDPPLSIPSAIQKAKSWISLKYKSFNADDVSHLSIGKIWEEDVKNRWYYTIGIQGKANVDGISAHKHFSVIILMSGEVVEPAEKEE